MTKHQYVIFVVVERTECLVGYFYFSTHKEEIKCYAVDNRHPFLHHFISKMNYLSFDLLPVDLCVSDSQHF